MLNCRWMIVAALAVSAAVASWPQAAQAKDLDRTVESATTVLKEFLDLSVKAIPASLLSEAHGVAIVPGVIKVGLVVGGQRGKGVIVVREKDGSWRAPMFLTMTGGSIGWQVGAQSTDFVLVFKTQKSVEGLLKGKFTIGADAAAAAGPVGRRAEAATDSELKAEIYSYSRTRGLFAGVSLDGTVLNVDDEANAAYYAAAVPGEPARAAPEAAIKLTQLIAQLAAKPELIEARPAEGAALPAPMPTPAGPALAPAGPVFAPQPAADAEAIQQELARSARQLSGLVDKNWQRYLALPDEVYRRGKHPAVKELRSVAARFDAVAADARYQALAERPEFQATRDLLRAYVDALSAEAAPKLALPPPPGGQR